MTDLSTKHLKARLKIYDTRLGTNSEVIKTIAGHLNSDRLLDLGEQLRELANTAVFGQDLVSANMPGAPRNRAERRKKAVGRKGGAVGERKNWKRKAFYE